LTAVALVIALVGYDLIHRAERWLTVFMIVIFGIFTVTLFFIHYPAGTFDVGSFKASPFLGQFGVVAGYQISWAIYVSDYSRYLPPDVTVRKTFYWTYWGSAIGGAWMMIVGATLAAWAGKSFDGTGIAELDKVGDHVFSGFGAIVLILAAAGLVSVTALNMYGGSLTLISAVDSFKRVRPTLSARVVTVAFTAALSLIGALAATQNFLGNFSNFLLLVLYLFVPWTAVNLVDYYIVRRGHYAIAEIFNPHGMYGRWGWRGILAYLIGFAAMVPFFNVGTLYEGAAAKALDGADISFFVGLPVAGLLYYAFTRSVDVAAETRIAEAEAAELERAAEQHRTS
jgi:purine-cytosine permease-like protein